MVDLESEIDMLRKLDILRVDSARLRNEGKQALIALLEQDTNPDSLLFCVTDINTPSLIAKLQNDANPATRQLSTFVWEQVPLPTRALLIDSTRPSSKRESALIHELNKILRGNSIYDSARFTYVDLRPDTRWLTAQDLTDERLVRLNRLLLQEAYPSDIAARNLLDILTEVLPVSDLMKKSLRPLLCVLLFLSEGVAYLFNTYILC